MYQIPPPKRFIIISYLQIKSENIYIYKKSTEVKVTEGCFVFNFSVEACLSPTLGAVPQTFAAALQYFAAAQCLLTRPLLPEADVLGKSKYLSYLLSYFLVKGG